MYLNRILVVFLATFVFFGFAFAGVDLSAGNIDFNDATVLYGTETVQITANYSNISIDTNAEGYNVYFYINSNLDSNVQHDENLNAGDSNTQDYNWTADEIGDINVYICLEAHALDDNADNDCNQTTLHVYSVDFNAIILYTSNDLPELGDFYFEYQAPVTIDFNFANNGDYNGDNNAETRLYKGAIFDMRNTTFENLFVGNVVTASFDNLLLDWGTYDLNAIICYGTCDVPATDVNDGNTANNFFTKTINVVAVDLNLINATVAGSGIIELGAPFTIMANMENVGDYNGSDDLNVRLQYNGVDVNDTNVDQGNYDTTDGSFPVYLEYTLNTWGSNDLNIFIDYLGLGDDNDSTNNYILNAPYSVVAVDLNITELLFPGVTGNLIEYGIPLVVNTHFQNLGDYNGSGNLDINLAVGGSVEDYNNDYNVGDYNTGSVYDLNLTFTPGATGPLDLNVTIDYNGLGDDNNPADNFLEVTDINVVSVDLNAETLLINSSLASNVLVEIGQPFTVDFNFANRGDYNGNGFAYTIFNYVGLSGDENIFSYTDGNFDINIPKAVSQVSITPTAVGTLVDMNVDVNYTTTTGAVDYDTSNQRLSRDINVGSVDLNGQKYLAINDSTSSPVLVEYGSSMNIDFNYMNQGDVNGAGDANIIFKVDTTDVNYQIDATGNYNINSNKAKSYDYTYSPTTLGTKDVNVRVIYSATESDTTNNSLANVDANVVAVDLNAEYLSINDSIATTIVEKGVAADIDFNLYNRGTYNGLGDINVILSFDGVYKDSITYDDGNFDVNTNKSVTFSCTPTAKADNNDLNIRLIYIGTEGLEKDGSGTSNSKVMTVDIGAVDLNAETLLINGVSTSNVVVEVDQPFTIDFNFANRGDYNGNGTAYVMFDYNGGTDENTQTDPSFDINAVNAVPQVSITPTAVGTLVDMNVDVNYTTTTGAVDYDTSNQRLSRDINVGSVDLNAISVALSASSVTVNNSVTVTLTFENNGVVDGLEDVTATLSDGTTTTSSTISAGGFDIDESKTVAFTYTPTTTGTKTLTVSLSYAGTETDKTQNSASGTLTVNAAPSGGNTGGSTAGIPKANPDGSRTFTFNTGSSESPLYINTVETHFKTGQTDDSSILKVVITPILKDSEKIKDSAMKIIKYLELKYYGDLTKLDFANVVFTLKKSEVTDPALIKLGRLKDGVWNYFTPTKIEDKGTFYSFTVTVPGFSFFAIVSVPVSAKEVTPQKETEEGKGVTEDKTTEGETEGTTTVEEEKGATTSEEVSEGIAWWMWVIIGVVIVVIIAIIVYTRKR